MWKITYIDEYIVVITFFFFLAYTDKQISSTNLWSQAASAVPIKVWSEFT